MKTPQYTTIRKRGRKSVSIIVRPDRTVRIIVPEDLHEQAVEQIALNKRNWINKKLDELGQSDFQRIQYFYEQGEHFLYQGRYLTLHTVDGRGNISLSNETIQVSVPHGLQGKDRALYIRQKLLNCYRVQALQIFRERTSKIGEKYGLIPDYVAIKDYKSRWGSCFSDGRIYYNWRLILAPENIMDYVIAHELCHLKEANHSKRFWLLVETMVPEWRSRRKWLRINGHALNI